MITARFYRARGEILLAACDTDLLGQCLVDDTGLRFDLGGSFYRGQDVSEPEFRTMLLQATSGNLVGQRTVNIAVEMDMVDPDSVMRISGVPHAMFFTV